MIYNNHARVFLYYRYFISFFVNFGWTQTNWISNINFSQVCMTVLQYNDVNMSEVASFANMSEELNSNFCQKACWENL